MSETDRTTPERIDEQIKAIMGTIFGLPMDDDLRDRLVGDLEKIGCRDIAVSFSPNGEVIATGATILDDGFKATLHVGSSVS